MVDSTTKYSVIGSEFYHHGLNVGFANALKIHIWSGFGCSSLTAKSKKLALDIDTSTTTTDGMYHDFGIGISDRLNILRIDVVRDNVLARKILVSLKALS